MERLVRQKASLACLLAAGVLALAGVARAASGDDAPVPSESGPAASLRPFGEVSDPHGPSAASSGLCPACHGMNAEGRYPFTWASRVTEGCLQCHPDVDASAASGRYAVASGHAVAGPISLAGVSSTSGGLQCVSCHSFHGGPDGVVNGWTRADEGKRIWWQDPGTSEWSRQFLHYDQASRGWQVCESPGVRCVPAEVLDARGQLTPLYGYKLLSAYPGGSAQIRIYDTTPSGQDQSRWCGACHPSHVDGSMGEASDNHPTACSACHGNPANGSSGNFPHASTMPRLLIRYPDALCVRCHTKGSLP